jgi:IS5 family transposase
MRRKKEAVLTFEWNNDHLPKTVREYRQKYKGISRLLDENPRILDRVHEDLKKLSEGGRHGRNADFTSETILRALVVHAIEGLALRETVILIAGSDFLQDFLRTRKKAVMDFTFLDKCLLAIRPVTWRRVNQLLGLQAVEAGQVNPKVIRTDTTVVESNIHWPTDSSLLWDTWRVASRLLKRGRSLCRASCVHRFHDKKVKRLHLLVTRYFKSTSKKRRREVQKAMRTLVERVAWIVEIAREFCRFGRKSADVPLQAVATELAGFLPAMAMTVEQARRRAVEGETVPAAERVFSIFEPHTELIKRGRRQKPVEFGHAVLLCQTPEKFITDYEVFEERPADCSLTASVIDRHEKLFGEAPEVLAADKGFCPDAEEYAELEERIDTLAIPRRMRDFADAVMSTWQAFRAGIEGTISGLKRAFRLSRCFYRGFKGFGSAMGLGVFSHNLIVLAKQGAT